MNLPPGTRIIFIKTLREAASGDHPAFLYAVEGELGEVIEFGTPEGYWVRTDGWPNKFGASHESEFIVDVNRTEPAILDRLRRAMSEDVTQETLASSRITNYQSQITPVDAVASRVGPPELSERS